MEFCNSILKIINYEFYTRITHELRSLGNLQLEGSGRGEPPRALLLEGGANEGTSSTKLLFYRIKSVSQKSLLFILFLFIYSLKSN